jgi:hypothetical protein
MRKSPRQSRYRCVEPSAKNIKQMCHKVVNGEFSDIYECAAACVQEQTRPHASYSDYTETQEPEWLRQMTHMPRPIAFAARPQEIHQFKPNNASQELRSRLLLNHYGALQQPVGDIDSLDTFTSIMLAVNTAQRSSSHGVFYPFEYADMYSSANHQSISKLAHPRFFNNAFMTHFIAKGGVRPDDALRAFFQGPTMADCANVIYACIYKWMVNQYGSDVFDNMFSSPLTNLLITNYLYQGFFSKYVRMRDEPSEERRMLDLKAEPIGNPLRFLFDEINSKDPNDFQDQDILHIAGVPSYSNKHLAGFGGGWNLFCHRPNPHHAPLFIGFDADTFTRFLSYDEVVQLLINSYNKPQNRETVVRIEHFGTLNFLSSPSEREILNHSQATLAHELRDHQVAQDDPTVGKILGGIRLNRARMDEFAEQHKQPRTPVWLKFPAKIPAKPPLPSTGGKVTWFSKPVPVEHTKSTLDNFKTEGNETKALMLRTVRQFCNAIVDGLGQSLAQRFPMGLVLNGRPGIGKTHLAIGLSRYLAALTSATCVFVDAGESQLLYEAANTDTLARLFETADVIVIDDLNAEYDRGATVFKQALEYVLLHNKALLVTNNSHEVDVLSCIPKYFAYDDPTANCFMVLSDLINESLRVPWTTTAFLDDPKPLVDRLCTLDTTLAAGIVVLDTYKDDVIRLVDSYGLKTYTAGDAYRGGKITSDYYFTKMPVVDLVFINVANPGGCEQLMNLVTKGHQSGLRIVVFTTSFDAFCELVKIDIDRPWLSNLRQRKLDRFRVIFPGVVPT